MRRPWLAKQGRREPGVRGRRGQRLVMRGDPESRRRSEVGVPARLLRECASGPLEAKPGVGARCTVTPCVRTRVCPRSVSFRAPEEAPSGRRVRPASGWARGLPHPFPSLQSVGTGGSLLSMTRLSFQSPPGSHRHGAKVTRAELPKNQLISATVYAQFMFSLTEENNKFKHQ